MTSRELTSRGPGPDDDGVPWLLHVAAGLFPEEFRARYGAELLEAAEDQLADRAAGWRRRIAALGLFRSLLRAALAERIERLARRWRRSLTPPPPPRRLTGPRSSAMGRLFEALHTDLRYALRSLRKSPGFVLVAVATLALGIGASTTVFSVVYDVLVKPLPFGPSHRLVSVHRLVPQAPGPQNMSIPDLHDVGEQAGTLKAAFGYTTRNLTWTGFGEPRVVEGASVSAPFLRVFELRPALGREFSEEELEYGGPDAVIVSYSFWKEELEGRPDVLGEALELSARPHTIVGVAPEGFDYPRGARMWTPRLFDPDGCGRGCHFLKAVGLLQPDASLEEAQTELATIGARLEQQYPESNTHKTFSAVPLQSLLTKTVRPALYLLLGAVLLVQLIAATNVANLVLVRGLRRRGELALRVAIGAARGRLFRQLVLENALLGILAGALGLALGAAGLRIVLRFAPPLPRFDEVTLDLTVVAAAGLATLLMLLCFGVAPAWRAASRDLRSRLGRRQLDGRLARSGLLALEVCLSLVLLVGAGLLIRSLDRLMDVDLGFETREITSFSVSLPDERYTDFQQELQFFDRLTERLAAIPGVSSVGAAFRSPLGENDVSSGFLPTDRPPPAVGEELGARYNVVTRGFFETLGVPLLAGRAFEPGDRMEAPPVALVNQALAERYFPGEEAVGKQFVPQISFGNSYPEDEPYTVIGVVADTLAYTMAQETGPEVYFAQSQSVYDALSYVVRAAPGVDVVAQAAGVLRELDPELPLRRVQTLEERIDRELGPSRFYALLLTVLAVTALTLAAVGLYSVIAFLVSERRREFAVRIAVGADRGNIIRSVLRSAVPPVLAGTLAGAALALLGARSIRALLFEVSPLDPVTFGLSAALLVLVALLASRIPAGRASRIAPMTVLKTE